MGCCFSSAGGAAADEQLQAALPSKREAPTKSYQRPRWKSTKPLPQAQLQAMRSEYWDTQPHYGGDKVIWDAIKAAVAAPDMATTRLLLEAAGVIVARPDMTVMYDERGARYVLPPYVLAPPSNLVQEAGGQGSSIGRSSNAGQQQHQLAAGEVQLQPQRQ